jgi:HlyD family secretion protein
MSKRSLVIAAILVCAAGAGPYFGIGFLGQPDRTTQTPPGHANQKLSSSQVICTGMVESTGGEIDVFSQMSGELAEVRITEGDAVQKGQVLAVVDARRFAAELAAAEANAAVAKAKLKRVQAGVGDEEKQEALFAVEATEALLAYERKNLNRARLLHQTKAVTLDELQRAEQQVEHLAKQVESLRKHHAAIVRGPLPEEVEMARAEIRLAEERVRQAKVNHEYRTVYAPSAGTVLQVYRHAGDSVLIEQITPVLRMVDSSRLRIRLEIDEADAPRLKPPQEGAFQIRGVSENTGHLVIRTVIPQFGPKRLFNPDNSARVDTRTLSVLCEIKKCSLLLYPGQRITAAIPMDFPNTSATAKPSPEPGCGSPLP